MAPPPQYFALKRTILMVICVISILFLILSYIVAVEIVEHMPEEDYFDQMNKDQMILVVRITSLFCTLVMFCGLFGAWCHNLPLMYTFTAFLVLFNMGEIVVTFRRPYRWPGLCFFGAVMALAISILIDLHKMKRGHNQHHHVNHCV